MAVYGSLETMPMAELLTWLKTTGKAGTLTVVRDECEWEIGVEGGRVVSYVGPELKDDLGHIVVTSGLLTESDLRETIAYQRERRIPLQRAFLDKGMMTREQLHECLIELARESIYDLFIDLPGEFIFTAERDQALKLDIDDAGDSLPIDLDVNVLLLEGARRQDEWSHVRERFPNDQGRLVIVDEKMPPIESLAVRERRILASINAGQSIADICVELRAPVPSVLRAISHFVDLGALQIVSPEAALGSAPAAAGERVAEFTRQAQVLRAAGQYEEAIALLETAVRMQPELDSARIALKELLAEQIEELYRALPPLKVPVVVVGPDRLARLKLRPEERSLLDRLQAKMDVGSLIMVSSLNERETLRTLRRLLHGGIIELR